MVIRPIEWAWEELKHLEWKYREGFWIVLILLVAVLLTTLVLHHSPRGEDWTAEYNQMRLEESYR